MNRVLIAGGSSFVGANLTKRFKRLGYKVLVIEYPEANLWRLSDLVLTIDIVLVDLDDNVKMLEIVEGFKPNIIVNTFSYGSVPDQDSISKIYKINFEGPTNLLKACKVVGFDAFLTLGSAEEYGCAEGQLSEHTLPRPTNDYGAAKAMFTTYALKHSYAQECPVYCLRPFSIFGDYSPEDKLIGSLFLSIYYDEAITLRAAQRMRDFLYIDDLVDLILLICQKRPQSHYLFNAGSQYCYTILEVTKKIEAIAGKNLQIKLADIKPMDFAPQTRFANTSLAKKVLGWTPKYTFEQGIIATKFWFDEHYSLYNREERCISSPVPSLF